MNCREGGRWDTKSQSRINLRENFYPGTVIDHCKNQSVDSHPYTVTVDHPSSVPTMAYGMIRVLPGIGVSYSVGVSSDDASEPLALGRSLLSHICEVERTALILLPR